MTKLRYYIFLVALIIIGFSNADAQNKFSLGFSSQIHNTRLTINLANLNTQGAYRPTSSLFAEYDFGKRMSIHTGLGYTMMTQNSDAFKNNFHYIAMPLYLKIGRFKENRRFAFSAFFGTNLHYLLGAQHIYSDDTKNDIMDQSRKFHFDLTFGEGVKYKLSDRYTIEVLTLFSVGSMINTYNAAYTEVYNLNTGFMLNLKYRF